MMQDKIMDVLRNQASYISGEALSQQLNISRSGIWKNIQELRKQGYVIEAVPHKGYRVTHYPDKLYPREIRNNLKAKSLGCCIHHFESIESTMPKAFQLAINGADEGTIVCAETQTQGKGRLGREWISSSTDGIYMSIILRPQVSPIEVSKITLMVAVAVCEAINSIEGVESKIKWPNDILINEKKVAGILTELHAEMERVHFVVVGVGINVNTNPKELPEEGISLKQANGGIISRLSVVQNILASLEKWYDVFQDKKTDEILDRWKELSTTIGRRVCVSDIEGIAVDLDASGQLIIKKDNGELFKHLTGDVVLL